MILPLDALLRREVDTFTLRFTCESCAHFDGEVAPDGDPPGRCSLGFPHAPHTTSTFRGPAEGYLFCKAFELS